MAEKLGEVLGTIIGVVVATTGIACVTGWFIGITAGIAVSVYGLF